MALTAASGRVRQILRDRIQANSALIVLCFVSVFLLESQSAASYSTYFLALSMLLTVGQWNDVFRVRMLWVILALLGWLALSGLWSKPFVLRDFASTLVRGMLVFLFVVAFAECQLRGLWRQWLGRALVLVGLIAVLAALWVYYTDPPSDGRLNGLGQLDTQVIAALVYGVVLIFVIDVILTDKSTGWRYMAGISAFAVGYAVYLSDSRNAWVSVLIGAGVFGLAHLVENRQRFVAAAAAMTVVLTVLLGALIANEATRDFVLPRGDSFRPEIWELTVQRVEVGNPWIGLGINTSDDVVFAGRTFLHSHSMYLSVVEQGGLIALALMIVLVGFVVRSLIWNYEKDDAKFALGVITVALSSYLLDGHELVDKVGATWLLFWLPVSVALGYEWSQPIARSI